jgi:heat-inducible transcriptional repressor
MESTMITKRQEKILNTLTQEYIKTAKPVSSKFLEKKCKLGVCPATIRIELQKLAELGFIKQPHTSAGRVPTNTAYRFFLDKVFSERKSSLLDLVSKEVEATRKQIEQELKLAEELRSSLEEIFSVFEKDFVSEKDDLFEILIKLGPSRTTYSKNISLMDSLIKEFENF